MSKLLRPANREVLFMGNEAIARGALEAGVSVASGYPGTPSSEVIENLAAVAKERKLYVDGRLTKKWRWKWLRPPLSPDCAPCA